MKALLALALLTAPALADAPLIEAATATRTGDTWTISVTLSHPDTGWDHYADGWRVETPAGTQLGTRELVHPHVAEQPFTRSLSGVVIPPKLSQVKIRARDNRDGWSPKVFKLSLPR